MSLRRRLRDFFREWMARRAGRRGIGPNDLGTAARHMAGPTGELWSRGWERMAKDHKAYVKSFDRKLPPSLFVSERDRTRLGQPIPLPERAIDEVLADPSTRPTAADYEAAFAQLDAERAAADGEVDEPPSGDEADGGDEAPGR